jgi:hypothetical protein
MPDDPKSDPFRPPEIPTEVGCLHCQQVYESYLIEWRERTCADGKVRGFWCCPTPGCDGAGFGFDILPTDPEYQDEHGGWIRDDDADDDDDDEELDEAGEFKEDGNYLGNLPDFEPKNGDDEADTEDDEEIPF